jgi:hypothetical protein
MFLRLFDTQLWKRRESKKKQDMIWLYVYNRGLWKYMNPRQKGMCVIRNNIKKQKNYLK